MDDQIIGHGPAPDFGPYVPDYLIIMDIEGQRRTVSRDGDSDVPPERLTVTACTPEPFRPGSWPMIIRGADIELPLRVEWFLLSEEETWRVARAQSLLASAQAIHGKPELILRTVLAASALVAIDIEKVARDLSAAAFVGETIDQTYERKKR